VYVFQLPVLPELAWRGLHPLARRGMARAERLPPGGHWATTLGRDGAQGVQLYRANILPRLRGPVTGHTRVPVQVVVPRHDRFLEPAVYDDLPRFVDELSRVDVDAAHWVPRTHPALVADLVARWAQRR
ncbi:MAG: short chain dehydrogenase, partial [Actinomycetota bacterium]|nr:short chain dehydrogenase [Actinomycetota bacterium]